MSTTCSTSFFGERHHVRPSAHVPPPRRRGARRVRQHAAPRRRDAGYPDRHPLRIPGHDQPQLPGRWARSWRMATRTASRSSSATCRPTPSRRSCRPTSRRRKNFHVVPGVRFEWYGVKRDSLSPPRRRARRRSRDDAPRRSTDRQALTRLADGSVEERVPGHRGHRPRRVQREVRQLQRAAGHLLRLQRLLPHDGVRRLSPRHVDGRAAQRGLPGAGRDRRQLPARLPLHGHHRLRFRGRRLPPAPPDFQFGDTLRRRRRSQLRPRRRGATSTASSCSAA